MTRNVLRRNQVEAFFSPPLLMLCHYVTDLRSVRRRGKLLGRLDASAASATRSTSPIMGNRRDILNPANPEPMTCQHSDRGLGSRTRGPSSMTPRRSNTDMERGYPLIFRNLGGSCSGLHRRVRGPLQSISLHMLTPSTTGDRLRTSKIRNVDHRVVETGVDMGDSPMICRLLSLLRHDLYYPEKLPLPAREFKPLDRKR
jgi:hypothetical protein